jgi:phosphoglycerate dehydrogenase-like enzyme
MTTRVWLHVDLPKDEPAALQKEFPDVEFVVGEALPQDALQGVEAIFLTKMPDDDVVEQMPKLRWLHGTMGGARGMLTPAVSQRPIMVSASKGTSASSMSEFALACLFTLKKRVLTCRQLQHEGQAKEIASLARYPGRQPGGVTASATSGGRMRRAGGWWRLSPCRRVPRRAGAYA